MKLTLHVDVVERVHSMALIPQNEQKP